MSDKKRALVLHLPSGGEPLVFALSEEGATVLEAQLPQLLSEGVVQTPALADGTTVAVNFAHVATAHIDELPRRARVYGSGEPHPHGFAT